MEVALVWWLMFSTPNNIVPVPYQEHEECVKAGELADTWFVCVQQPEKDVRDWTRSHANGSQGGRGYTD